MGRFAKVHTINEKIIMKETSDENDDDDKSDENGNTIKIYCRLRRQMIFTGMELTLISLNLITDRYALLIIVLPKANLPKKLLF